MLVKEYISKIEEKFPLALQQSYDNSGIQIEGPNVELHNVIITLDITEQAVERAIQTDAQMILSHHPIFFHPLKSIRSDDFKGRIIYTAIMNSLTVYSCHTNYDAAIGGLNDILARLLEMKECHPLVKIDEYGNGIGRIGLVKRRPIEEFVNFVREKLEVDHVKFAPIGNVEVEKIAICSGSGGDFLKNAIDAGADLYITGDLSYHEISQAVQSGISVIVVDHDESEKFFEDGMIEFSRDFGFKVTKYHERFYWTL
ncbi:Nif3-like dinuclear metal center hexameric protein [Athalassotoga saccharophila]|uniref:Nif3-like dinuclear metal center hexameric protein n=1 Tax=Athalassotoga saccharophila TaxID=1441386 RepID=UPI00137A28B6|nr:Nif3-like dinuclear metal center hexameric protein [Athalassotoga saccharophila]BBJ28187.1 GTP cyclohydrolase 1 type 2 [Athalassotoga saccharophila]